MDLFAELRRSHPIPVNIAVVVGGIVPSSEMGMEIACVAVPVGIENKVRLCLFEIGSQLLEMREPNLALRGQSEGTGTTPPRL